MPLVVYIRDQDNVLSITGEAKQEQETAWIIR
jgi:hypothetical protein